MAKTHNLLSGEMLCPRKSTPFPAIIAAHTCKMLHDESPGRCEVYNCKSYEEADKRVSVFEKDFAESQVNAAKAATRAKARAAKASKDTTGGDSDSHEEAS